MNFCSIYGEFTTYKQELFNYNHQSSMSSVDFDNDAVLQEETEKKLDIFSEENSADDSDQFSVVSDDSEFMITDNNCSNKCYENDNWRTIECGEIDELRDWAIDCGIKFIHLDRLLNILRKKLIPTLPKGGKIFLKSFESQYEILPMVGLEVDTGEFVYMDIEKNIILNLDKAECTDDTLLLQINVNGVSLFKSSTKQMWSIL